MEQHIRDWIAWLTVRGLSMATVGAYAWQVRRFAAAVAKGRPSDYETRDLIAYVAGREGWGASARKLAVNALRSFFGWALGERSPAAAVPMPRPKLRRQRTLSAREVEAVGACIDTSKCLGRRDVALLGLALDTGLRAAELCRLALADVDLDRRSLVVVVKGGQEAAGVFTVATANALLAWLPAREARSGVEAVFVTVFGRPLTPYYLRAMCRRWALRAGIPAFSPHALRRSMATLATAAGAPTRLVQLAGRWSDVRMVERYTASLDPGAMEAYAPGGLLSSVLKRS